MQKNTGVTLDKKVSLKSKGKRKLTKASKSLQESVANYANDVKDLKAEKLLSGAAQQVDNIVGGIFDNAEAIAEGAFELVLPD